VSTPTSLIPPTLPSNYRSTVLIIDDTPANLGETVECLETQGLRVLIAQDGAEGLRRAELVQPDLILMDVVMPRMDGFEVCRRLKKIPAVRDTPVIFMTALSESREKILGW
jgi:two-component system, sensor histidine kinase and response regulator